MLTTADPFDADAILKGIRSWVEIETPTEEPEQVNRLATMVADGYRGLPAAIERVRGQGWSRRSSDRPLRWGQDKPGILVLSHLDTVHPMGFIERLPFRVDGDVAFGPGIYDMKGGAYLAYRGVQPALRRTRSKRRSASRRCTSPTRRSAARPRAR